MQRSRRGGGIWRFFAELGLHVAHCLGLKLVVPPPVMRQLTVPLGTVLCRGCWLCGALMLLVCVSLPLCLCLSSSLCFSLPLSLCSRLFCAAACTHTLAHSFSQHMQLLPDAQETRGSTTTYMPPTLLFLGRDSPALAALAPLALG